MDMVELRHIFSTRIRRLRERKLSQGEFADSIGVSHSAMSLYERELRTPDIGVLRAICEKYNISADYLLGLMPDPNSADSVVCRETGLSPPAVQKLKLMTRLVETDLLSPKHHMDVLKDDFLVTLKLTAYMFVPTVLNVLLESDEGIALLSLLGAVIFDSEIDDDGKDWLIAKLRLITKDLEIDYPIENITVARWGSIPSNDSNDNKLLR